MLTKEGYSDKLKAKQAARAAEKKNADEAARIKAEAERKAMALMVDWFNSTFRGQTLDGGYAPRATTTNGAHFDCWAEGYNMSCGQVHTPLFEITADGEKYVLKYKEAFGKAQEVHPSLDELSDALGEFLTDLTSGEICEKRIKTAQA